MIYTNGFIPLITRPTRSVGNTNTLTDNILANNIDELKHAVQGIFVTDVSDHYPIFYMNWRISAKNVEKYSTCRIMNRKSYETFVSLITAYDWREVYVTNDTNEAFSYFHSNFKLMYDHAFPNKKIKKRYHARKPWLTECLNLSIKKNRLYINTKNTLQPGMRLIIKLIQLN